MHSPWADDAPFCDCPGCAARSHQLRTACECWRTQPASQPANHEPLVPSLLLHGNCLARAGFDVGVPVRVDIGEGRILIEIHDPVLPLETEVRYETVGEWKAAHTYRAGRGEDHARD